MRTIAILVCCLLFSGCYAAVTPPGVHFGTYGYGYGYAGDPCRQHANRCAEHVTVPVVYRTEMTSITPANGNRGRRPTANPADRGTSAAGGTDRDAEIQGLKTEVSKLKGGMILLLEEEKREEKEGK